MKKIFLILPALTLALNGCGPVGQSQNPSTVAAELPTKLSCGDARSEVFTAYYKAYETSADLSTESFRSQLEQQSSQNEKLLRAPEELREKYRGSLEALHEILTTEIASLPKLHAKVTAPDGSDSEMNVEAESDPVLHLIRLEMRSQVDARYDELNQKLDQALKDAQGTASTLELPCEPTAVEKVSAEAAKDPHSGDAHHGALYTMATAYQSCQVLDLPLVTKSVETVQGVIRSVSIDGVGWGRKYTDVDLLKKSHFYHHGQTYGPTCLSQNAKPLVYDYGGNPVTNTAAGTLDMFTNSGGGPALGIDCSAFISTSNAVAGNLYRTSTANKPVYTRFVSRDFIDPGKSGWSCYDSVKVNSDSWIQSGDIGAVEGHVVMVDRVGNDPFGLAMVSRVSQCDSLSYQNFDFSLIQSSSSKEHLGINRYLAKDYLSESGKVAALFVGYGKQACKSKFDHIERKPGTSSYGLIRHKTTASCVAPKIKLSHESCIEQCASL